MPDPLFYLKNQYICVINITMKLSIDVPNKFKPIIKKISETAKESGYETYAVGGFVRDLFLKREPKDLDIMVQDLNNNNSARFAGINFSKNLSKKYNLKEPVIFERFGTSKLFIEDEEVEFIMPRKEYYDKNSRNPDTEIGSLEQDALRRDFTINALFLRLSDMEVLDLTSMGIKDIENKIIRVTDIENASIIFEQDPLRILRAVRQSLQLGFEIENITYKAMGKSAKRISIVSPERIRDEINKILVESNPSKAILMMDDINILKEILPEVERLKNLKQPQKYHNDDVFNHTLKVLDRIDKTLALRMAALLHDIGKFSAFKELDGKITFYGHEIESAKLSQLILKRLKYSKELCSQVSNIIRNHMYPKQYSSEWSDAALRRFAKSCGSDLDFVLELSKFDFGKDMPDMKITEMINRIASLREKKILFPKEDILTGEEIKSIFNRPDGKWIGEVKEKITEILLENPDITKEELIKRITKL